MYETKAIADDGTWLVNHNQSYFLDQIEAMTKNGWELVSVDRGVAYFKRPIDVARCPAS